jgi:hypothetical protein
MKALNLLLPLLCGATLTLHAEELTGPFIAPAQPPEPTVKKTVESKVAVVSFDLPAARTKDGLPPAEIVDLDVLEGRKAAPKPALKVASAAKPSVSTPAPATPAIPDVKPADEVGFKTVLTGELAKDMVIGPDESPVLVKGMLTIPEGRTLFVKPGANIKLQPDADLAQLSPEATEARNKRLAGRVDLSKSGVIWVNGRLLADGLSGSKVEISAPTTDGGGIYFYGSQGCELRGVKLTKVSVVQSGGPITWLGCEFNDSQHYALSGGSAILQHCTFRRSGGIYAAYDSSRWALMASRCQFEDCDEGFVLGNNPGADALVVSQNNFIRPKGPVLRSRPGKSGNAQELLVGENYYGTEKPELAEARILDQRADANLRRINTRPPADKPFLFCGAGVKVDQIALTYQNLEPAKNKLLAAQSGKTAPVAKKETKDRNETAQR